MGHSMKVERYAADEHEAQVIEWCKGRDVPATVLKFRPEIGLIVPGYVVGFLYQTDSPIAIIEGVVANPDTEESERFTAIWDLWIEMIRIAKELGYQELWGYSAIPAMRDMCIRLGYRGDDTQYWFGSRRLR